MVEVPRRVLAAHHGHAYEKGQRILQKAYQPLQMTDQEKQRLEEIREREQKVRDISWFKGKTITLGKIERWWAVEEDDYPEIEQLIGEDIPFLLSLISDYESKLQKAKEALSFPNGIHIKVDFSGCTTPASFMAAIKEAATDLENQKSEALQAISPSQL